MHTLTALGREALRQMDEEEERLAWEDERLRRLYLAKNDAHYEWQSADADDYQALERYVKALEAYANCATGVLGRRERVWEAMGLDDDPPETDDPPYTIEKADEFYSRVTLNNPPAPETPLLVMPDPPRNEDFSTFSLDEPETPAWKKATGKEREELLYKARAATLGKKRAGRLLAQGRYWAKHRREVGRD